MLAQQNLNSLLESSPPLLYDRPAAGAARRRLNSSDRFGGCYARRVSELKLACIAFGAISSRRTRRPSWLRPPGAGGSASPMSIAHFHYSHSLSLSTPAAANSGAGNFDGENDAIDEAKTVPLISMTRGPMKNLYGTYEVADDAGGGDYDLPTAQRSLKDAVSASPKSQMIMDRSMTQSTPRGGRNAVRPLPNGALDAAVDDAGGDDDPAAQRCQQGEHCGLLQVADGGLLVHDEVRQ